MLTWCFGLACIGLLPSCRKGNACRFTSRLTATGGCDAHVVLLLFSTLIHRKLSAWRFASCLTVALDTGSLPLLPGFELCAAAGYCCLPSWLCHVWTRCSSSCALLAALWTLGVRTSDAPWLWMSLVCASSSARSCFDVPGYAWIRLVPLRHDLAATVYPVAVASPPVSRLLQPRGNLVRSGLGILLSLRTPLRGWHLRILLVQRWAVLLRLSLGTLRPVRPQLGACPSDYRVQADTHWPWGSCVACSVLSRWIFCAH
jgi:hypothetical protein